MSSHAKMLAVAVMLLAVAAVPAWSQVPPATAPTPGVQAPPPAAPSAPSTVEGKVKHVDPVARTISVSSGWFGFLFGKTLQVEPDTQITVAGRDSNLAAIQEGTKVRASYERRNGKMVATRIEVLSRGEMSRLN